MIELHGNNVSLLIDPLAGGRLASLRLFGQELLVTTATNALQWGCYPMAPWSGRLARGVFDYEGEQYHMPRTFDGHAIHGTLWNSPWDVVDHQSLRAPLGAEWPFGGYAEQRFALEENCLEMCLSLHADEHEFPASIGWHPWFRRKLDAGGAAQLRFVAGAMYEVDEQLIPTGRLCPPSEGPWDDCFTDMQTTPEICWPGQLCLTMQSSLSHWVVYDQPRHALCVEPCSAAPNALNMQPATVRPGEPLVGIFRLSWQRSAD